MASLFGLYCLNTRWLLKRSKLWSNQKFWWGLKESLKFVFSWQNIYWTLYIQLFSGNFILLEKCKNVMIFFHLLCDINLLKNCVSRNLSVDQYWLILHLWTWDISIEMAKNKYISSNETSQDISCSCCWFLVLTCLQSIYILYSWKWVSTHGPCFCNAVW